MHRANDGHPECPERLESILFSLNKPEFLPLERKEASKASVLDLQLAHTEEHIEGVLGSIPALGLNFLDEDTLVCPMSGEAALRAAGAVLDAVQLVLSTDHSNAFCAVRPPGHHAHKNHPAGFCLFNNVAIGALAALKKYGLKFGVSRVAIVDFDVHHGDGTQDIAWHEENILFISTHQFPLYPGTGAASERGAFNNILNIPLLPESNGGVFRGVMENTILPRLEDFKPDLIFVSAGFDAHTDDPLAQLALEDEDFSYAMGELVKAANRLCNGRLIAVLEGGYNLDALGRSVALCLNELMKDNVNE